MNDNEKEYQSHTATIYTIARIYEIGNELVRNVWPSWRSMKRTRAMLPRAERWRLP